MTEIEALPNMETLVNDLANMSGLLATAAIQLIEIPDREPSHPLTADQSRMLIHAILEIDMLAKQARNKFYEGS